MHCPNCGTPLADGTAFCPNCGNPVRTAAPGFTTQPTISQRPMSPMGNPMIPIANSMNKSIPGVSGGSSLSVKAILAGIMALITLIMTFAGDWVKLTIEIFSTSTETFKLPDLISENRFVDKIGLFALGLSDEEFTVISVFGIIITVLSLITVALFILAALKAFKNPNANMGASGIIGSIICIVTCMITMIVLATEGDPEAGVTISAGATQWILIVLNVVFLLIMNIIPSGSSADATPAVPPTMGNNNFGGYSPMR